VGLHDNEVMTLYLVATPIGNLEDITLRALRLLKEVDLILAEDTRHSRKLLNHFAITTPLESYHQHSGPKRVRVIVEQLMQGKTMALVSDAGTPAVSDPGVELVQACIAQNISVVALPGANAVLSALIISGLPTDRFVFEGFLDDSQTRRREQITAWKTEPRTIVFYEAPHRLRKTLAELLTMLDPQRPLVWTRELTKIHEQIGRGSLQEVQHYFQKHEPKGEFSLVLAGITEHQPRDLSDEALAQELKRLLKAGQSPSEAARLLAEETGLPRRRIYRLSLELGDF
jgi:16S rRNA (cytidine1402-2'-O)-methyltransferase